MNADELAIMLGTKISIKWAEPISKFYAGIDGLYLVEGIVISTVDGYADTRNEAIKNFEKKLAGKTVQYQVEGKSRLNIPVSMGCE